MKKKEKKKSLRGKGEAESGLKRTTGKKMGRGGQPPAEVVRHGKKKKKKTCENDPGKNNRSTMIKTGEKKKGQGRT